MKNLLIAIILLLNINTARSQEVSELIDRYVSSYVSKGDFSGCVLISKEDSIIYNNCFGKANFSFDIDNTSQTKFKIGSISKQFTAAAILKLEEDGYLKTSDTLSSYYPNNKAAAKIIIEQLLTHTSGIPDIYSIPDFQSLSCEKIGIADLSLLLLESELDFDPGSRYQYSNGGYAILADLIEKVSGRSYKDYLDKYIFQPLKMDATGDASANDVISNLSTGYDPLGYSQLKISDFIDPELLKGSGSLYSTVHDLSIWIKSIIQRSLLQEDSYRKLLNNYGNNYGLGISVYKSFGNNVFGHDGRVNGYIADYLHYEESGMSIIIVGNIQTGVADFLRRDIAAILFEKEYRSRAKSVLPGERGLKPDSIIGTYSFGENFKVHVESREGRIQARANEGGYSELVYLKDGRYFSRTLYSYINFQANDEGIISKMIWTNNNGNNFEGIKEL